MTKIEAVPVVSVDSCKVAADGRTALLQLASAQGPFTLAITREGAQGILRLLSGAASQIAKRELGNDNAKFVATAERWEVGSRNDRLIFAFHLPGGGEQAFQVSLAQAPAITEAIRAALNRRD